MSEEIQISTFINATLASVDSNQKFLFSISYQRPLPNLIALLSSLVEMSRLQEDYGEWLTNTWHLKLKCTSVCVSDKERDCAWIR